MLALLIENIPKNFSKTITKYENMIILFFSDHQVHLFFDRSRENPCLESSFPCQWILNSNGKVDHLQAKQIKYRKTDKTDENR